MLGMIGMNNQEPTPAEEDPKKEYKRNAKNQQIIQKFKFQILSEIRRTLGI